MTQSRTSVLGEFQKGAAFAGWNFPETSLSKYVKASRAKSGAAHRAQVTLGCQPLGEAGIGANVGAGRTGRSVCFRG